LARVLAVAVAVAVSACGPEIVPVGEGDPCIDGQCPYPLVCREAICVRPGRADPGSADDAGSGRQDDGGGPGDGAGDAGVEPGEGGGEGTGGEVGSETSGEAGGGCLAAEACNGRDDDCDGLTDEDWPDLGADCSAGTGACAATGTMVCAPTEVAVLCSASPGSPQPEACDGADNDCDGEVDEDDACQDHGSTAFTLQGSLPLARETTGGTDTWSHFRGAFICDDIDGDRFAEGFLFWPSAHCDWDTSDFDCSDDGVSGNSDHVYRIVTIDLNDPPEGAELYESHYKIFSSEDIEMPCQGAARHAAGGTEYYIKQQERIVRAERYVRSGGGQLVWRFDFVQATTQEYGCVAAGDLDGAAGDELVVGWRDARNWISVQGGAAGTATIELAAWERPFACAVGDQDGDSGGEVVVLAYVDGTGAPPEQVRHFVGVGLRLTGATLERAWTADFGAPPSSSGPLDGVAGGGFHLVAVDDDAFLDVVLGGRGVMYSSPFVLRATGAGVFGPGEEAPASLRDMQNVPVFDIDADGDVDLLGTNGGFARNDGHGGFRRDETVEPGETFDIPRFAYACDLTNDGEPDVVAVHRYDSVESVRVWTGAP
jgi:hypothetical protein